MRNIDVGSKYLDILQDHCITKAHSKAAEEVDNNYTPDVICGCDFMGRV